MEISPKSVVWSHGEVKSPPFSQAARLEAGVLLRRLQQGEHLSMPHAKSLSTIDKQCFELRIRDADRNWRIVYYIDKDAIVILEVFEKKTLKTPQTVIETCRQRLKRYKAEQDG